MKCTDSIVTVDCQMNAFTAQRFISVQSMHHDEMGVRSDSLTF